MKKGEVSLIALLSIAIGLIKVGMDLAQQGQYLYAIPFIIAGVIIMAVGVYLYTQGIIQESVKRALQKQHLGA